MTDVLASGTRVAMPRRARVTDRREQILDAALRLFAERGAGNVSTRQIAEAVGISQPTLYAHFASADAIADELCVRAFAALQARFAERVAAIADPWERLDAAGRTYIEFGLEHPDMYRIAFMPTRADAMPKLEVDLDADDPGLAAGLRAFAAVRETIGELMGGLGPATDVTAQTVWIAVHGITSLLIAKPYFPWADREALIVSVLAMARGHVAARASR